MKQLKRRVVADPSKTKQDLQPSFDEFYWDLTDEIPIINNNWVDLYNKD